jgi:hypothetical protein
VGIEAGRFVDDQQVLIFEEQARQHGLMKPDLSTEANEVNEEGHGFQSERCGSLG